MRLVRWLFGAVGTAIALNTVVGVARGRLTYSVERYVGTDPVALTSASDIALGAVYSAVMAALLLWFAVAPKTFRKPVVAIIGVAVLLAAFAGLDALSR